jgi:hypothetical protein
MSTIFLCIKICFAAIVQIIFGTINPNHKFKRKGKMSKIILCIKVCFMIILHIVAEMINSKKYRVYCPECKQYFWNHVDEEGNTQCTHCGDKFGI